VQLLLLLYSSWRMHEWIYIYIYVYIYVAAHFLNNSFSLISFCKSEAGAAQFLIIQEKRYFREFCIAKKLRYYCAFLILSLNEEKEKTLDEREIDMNTRTMRERTSNAELVLTENGIVYLRFSLSLSPILLFSQQEKVSMTDERR